MKPKTEQEALEAEYERTMELRQNGKVVQQKWVLRSFSLSAIFANVTGSDPNAHSKIEDEVWIDLPEVSQ